MPTTSAAHPKYRFSVQVEPEYLPDQSEPSRQLFGFAYTVTVTNEGSVPAQLISRHWIISDANGKVEEVKGLGVIGHQPLLQPGESFQYTSGCRLRTASGAMRGSFFCVAEDGERFEVEIAGFVLDAGGAAPRVLH